MKVPYHFSFHRIAYPTTYYLLSLFLALPCIHNPFRSPLLPPEKDEETKFKKLSAGSSYTRREHEHLFCHVYM